jgi:hypothetical protein
LDREKQVKEKRDNHKYFLDSKIKAAELDAQEAQQAEDKLNVFYKNLEASHDLKDNLDELCNFL